ncbi:MAG: VanW family protein [Clostridia bacterium]|nr:VanW family protein [Clostridia bacterium]
MSRKLFCEISPLTYRLSVKKGVIKRRLQDVFGGGQFATHKEREPLPVRVYRHNSLIRRQLGQVDMQLQENKAVNLSLAAPHVNGILIRPGETFSFWQLVGAPTKARGYREGLTISSGRTTSGIGGGMCQFTNLIHWMVLHSPLTVVERHHHNGLDLFPDFGRQVPFGTGTSVAYNYIDYRFRNDTGITFQLLVRTTDEYLCGELRADRQPRWAYHIKVENEGFVREADGVYRVGEIYRDKVDRLTGKCAVHELIQRNHARVMYDTSGLKIAEKVENRG